MDKTEIAMHLTLKAIDHKLAPYTGARNTEDIDKTVEFNAGQIANFYNTILRKLD